MKPQPEPAVQDWLDAQESETLYLSSVTVAELLFSVAALPDGRRKQKLGQLVQSLIELFEDRIVPFDIEAARHYATLAVAARSADKGFPTPDGYIAAIAGSRGFSVATRDGSAFKAAGVPVIDPWAARH